MYVFVKLLILTLVNNFPPLVVTNALQVFLYTLPCTIHSLVQKNHLSFSISTIISTVTKEPNTPLAIVTSIQYSSSWIVLDVSFVISLSRSYSRLKFSPLSCYNHCSESSWCFKIDSSARKCVVNLVITGLSSSLFWVSFLLKLSAHSWL